MKTSPPRILTRSIAALIVAGALHHDAQAASGTWSNIAGGSWPTTTNWTGGIVADGADFIADFSTLNITANATVNLDGARTIGGLKFGDATTVSNDWILNTGTAGPLTLDVTAGQATINVVNRTVTIGAVLAGDDGINVTGNATGASGTVIFNAANTFTGGLTISGAIAQINNALGAGTNTITVAANANLTSSNRLQINGGVTIANNIVIEAGASPLAGVGAIHYTGTGQATVNGTITINGNTANGGHLVGGATATVGNELVINGAINSSVTVAQREGRVIYRGGGSYTALTTTGAVIIGANDALPTGVALIITNTGGGTAGSLELGAFNQTIGSLNIAGGSLGTVTTGTGVLTLNGNLSSAGNFTHVVNGNVNLGGASRNFTVADAANAIDLQVGAALSNGTLNKLGAGTLDLTGTSTANASVGAGTLQIDGTSTGAVSVNSGGTLRGTGTASGVVTVNAGGTLAPATLTTTGTLTVGTLAFATGANNVRMKIGTGGDLVSTTTLTAGGTTTFNLNQLGGILPNGTYPLISYTGASPGLGGFVIAPLGHATLAAVDTGTAIAVQITANDRVIWDGTASTAWNTAASGNWKLATPLTATDFVEGDDVIFADAPTNSTVDIATTVLPSKVSFTNTAATTYTVTGAAGIAGTTDLTKTGNGTVVLRTQNSYGGATTVSAGTLDLDHDATGNVVLSGTSGVSVAAGATLKLSRDDGNISFNRNISGAGTVVIDPHTAAGAAVRDVVISGNNTGFSGQWKFSPSNVGAAGLGSFRTNTPVTATNLGSAVVDVDNGGQLWFTGTIGNDVTISGTGYAEAAGGTPVSLAAATAGGVYLGAGTAPFTYGGTGAIRMEGATLNGDITVDGTAKIGAVNGTGTINGDIGATGASDMLVIGGGTAAHSIIATGAISVPRILVNGGATTGSQTLQIGNNGTSGTISSPEIILYATAGNGVLRMHRTDGLTFTNQTIRGGAAVSADLVRTFFLVNTRGTGVTLDNSTLDLSDGVNGGTIRVGDTAGITGSILNIAGTSTVDVGFFTLGEIASGSGTVNQSGTSSVNFLTTLRVGHFPTNTSNYNISGGTLSTSTVATATFPYTTGATEQNGGIYLGIDGTGNLTQSGGTITTNFIVLDNRGDTSVVANTPTGVDTFQQDGGTLVLKSAYGLISRNPTTAVNLNGGTIQLAPGISSALDSNRITVQAGGVTLDTNGASTFTLYGPLTGAGTVSLTNTGAGSGILDVVDGGAGANITAGGTMPGGQINAPINIGGNNTLRSSRNVISTWNGALSGSGILTKAGTGSLALTGSGSGFTGTVNVNSGRLDVPANLAATAINVADAGVLSGEPTTGTLTLGVTTRGEVVFNPNTAGSLTATSFVVNGTASVLSFTEAPTGAGPWTAVRYTTRSGAGALSFLDSANYRNPVVINDTGSSVTVNITGTQPLVWTGTGGATWNVNTTNNWTNGTPAADVFFSGDTVTFNDTSAVGAVAIGGVSPWKTTVDSSTTAYTFASTGSGISGPGNLEKSGSTTLTLTGTNTYLGKTLISGGTVAIATANSLGSGDATNTIGLSNGGRLSYTGSTAVDFGANRGIGVGAGGGSISHNNGTAATLTIPGNLVGSGSDNLSFHSAAAAGTFVLNGNNSLYTGGISVDAQAAGLTVLRIGNSLSSPGGGSITVNFPAAGVNGNATSLDLPGTSLASGVTLNMTAQLNGAVSLRTQVTGTGISSIDGPITMTGNGGSVVQFSPGSGEQTLNGNITEATPGSFGVAGTPATVFFRGAGNTVINGTINLPNANVIRVDNTGVTTINSTGNNWNQTEVRSSSTLRIGIDDALDPDAVLLIGQVDAGNSFLDLNGFDQQVGGLNYIAGNGANTRGIINNGAGPSVLTINNTGNFVYGNGGAANAAGNISGNVAIVKNGAGSQTLAGAINTYTGNVTVNAGTLVAGGNQASTALGSPTVAGRTVAVNNSGTTLSFTTNNVYGNGVGNANLPSTILNAGTTLTSTRYNVLGPVTLNGATLTQSATDAGGYEGFQFKGGFTIGGTDASTISTGNGKANHLDSNTAFNVADATGNASADLIVSAPLRDQSGDFGGAAGGLTKTGLGTMLLSAVNTFTGATTVNAGTLVVDGSISASTATVNAGGTLGGGGILGGLNLAGGTLAPGNSPGILSAGNTSFGGGTLALEIFGTTPGSGVSGHDQLAVTGSVSFTGNVALTIDFGVFNPADNVDSFTIVSNDGSDAIALGGFGFSYLGNSLSEGEVFVVGSQQLSISYAGGANNNDVVLAAVPEPSSALAALSGLVMLTGLRRFRRLA